MKTIYKYKIEPLEGNSNLCKLVQMPKDAVIRTAMTQEYDICVWAEVDTEEDLEDVQFEVFATGQEMKQDIGIDRRYINSVSMENGSLIFHVYKRFLL